MRSSLAFLISFDLQEIEDEARRRHCAEVQLRL